MAYLSLYRKWRPQRFEDVVGQTHVVRTLINALEARRVAHAYMFCGPRGTGKTTVARLLAKGLNCEQGPTGHVCNTCENCQRIANGTSLDVIEIDGASNRGIDEIREIRERVHYAPAHASHKVYIVDEVHMLTQEAFNALLKMLEEPPSHVVFIFATTEAQKVPATILSRCQKFDFRRFAPADLVFQLKRVLDGEGIEYEPEALDWIARHAEGGMRDALGILDQCIAYHPEKVRVSTVQEVLGTAPRQKVTAFVAGLGAGNVGDAFGIIREVESTMGDLRQFARDVVGFLRDLMILKTAGSEADRLVSLPHSELAAARELAASMGIDMILRAIEEFGAAEADMRWSPTPALNLEMAVVRLTHETKVSAAEKSVVQQASPPDPAAKHVGEQAVLRQGEPQWQPRAAEVQPPRQTQPQPHVQPQEPAAGEAKPKPNVAAQTAPAVSAAAEGNDSGRKELPAGGKEAAVLTQGGWNQLLEQLRAERYRQIEAFLREGRPVRWKGDTLIVRFPENRSFHYANMQKHDHRQPVERLLGRMIGKPVKLEVILSDDEERPEPANNSPEQVGQELAAGSEETYEPALRAALEIFQGTIVGKREEEAP